MRLPSVEKGRRQIRQRQRRRSDPTGVMSTAIGPLHCSRSKQHSGQVPETSHPFQSQLTVSSTRRKSKKGVVVYVVDVVDVVVVVVVVVDVVVVGVVDAVVIGVVDFNVVPVCSQ